MPPKQPRPQATASRGLGDAEQDQVRPFQALPSGMNTKCLAGGAGLLSKWGSNSAHHCRSRDLHLDHIPQWPRHVPHTHQGAASRPLVPTSQGLPWGPATLVCAPEPSCPTIPVHPAHPPRACLKLQPPLPSHRPGLSRNYAGEQS